MMMAMTMKTTMRRRTRRTMMTIMMIITIDDDGNPDGDVRSYDDPMVVDLVVMMV